LGASYSSIGPHNCRILMNTLARSWTNVNKKPAISNGFLYFLELYWISSWWRRRESNPRPETFRCTFYVHSFCFGFRSRRLPEAGSFVRYPVWIFAPLPPGVREKLSCLNDASEPVRQAKPGRRQPTKRLLRNRSCLRLCFPACLTRPAGTSVRLCSFTHPRRNRDAPMDVKRCE